jgi:alkanesulfonate monooxygenase SsuD/methylene tetrahydromethanopterin reductase-like flavin-dependent oxidoreductase (luciferase family)
MSLLDLQRGIDFMRQTAEQAGRDPASLSVALRTGMYLTSVTGDKTFGKLPAPWEEAAAFTGEAERLPFRGTVEQVMEDIRQAERIGVDHLIFEPPVQRGDERFDTIEAFAQDVLPAFRQAVAPAG